MEEKISTSARLQQLLAERKLKQADVLRLAKPYCEQYQIKLNKSDLSQFVNGLVEPGQSKLFILAKALNVSEAWLMGLDVPMEREKRTTQFFLPHENITIDIAPLLTIILKRRGMEEAEAKRRAESIARIGALSPEGMKLIDAAIDLAETKE